MQWILLVITVIACAYGGYCYHMWKVFETGFIAVTKVAYNPQTREECEQIMENVKNEYFRHKATINQK